jgi:hypothetical protein
VGARLPSRAERREQGGGLRLCHLGPSPQRWPPDRPTHPPLRHGGLFLASTNPVEGDAAYLAAAATTQLAMQKGPVAFLPFGGRSGEQIWPLWETLHDTAVGLWLLEDLEASPDTWAS